MNIVQIGVGAWGSSWVSVLDASEHCDLVGVIDLDLERAQQAASAVGLGDAHAFKNLEQAAATLGDGWDAALVAVPPKFHAAVVSEVIEAGKHCLVEKPLTATFAEGREVAELAAERGVALMVSQNYRFRNAARTVRQVVQSGTIGEVELVTVHFAKDPPFEGFRLEMEEPLIHDMAIHHFDQLRSVSGIDPRFVQARSWNPRWSRFAGNACASVTFEDEAGRMATYVGSWVAKGRMTTWDGDWVLEGSKGALRWQDNRVELVFDSLFDTVFMEGASERNGVMDVDIQRQPFEERAGVLREFADAVETSREAETSAADNLKSLAMVLGAVRSAQEQGRIVDLRTLEE